jgi:hypothetical protein
MRCAPAKVTHGPLRPLTSLGSRLPFGGVPASRVPARQPGNFGVCITSLREVSKPPLREHLWAQMKVTKAKGLNATPFPRSARCGPAAQRATWKCRCFSVRQRTRRAGLGVPRLPDPTHVRRMQAEAGSEARRARGRTELRQRLKVARRADRPKREERAERCCVEPLCFGDFHLGPQMKVTRLPGRDPALGQDVSRPTKTDLGQRPRTGSVEVVVLVRLLATRYQPGWPSRRGRVNTGQ